MNRLTIENLKHIVAVTKDESLKLVALAELQRRELLLLNLGGQWMLTIGGIKQELRKLKSEKKQIMNTAVNTNRIIEITNAETHLKDELIKLLETQLNKKKLVG